MHLQNSKWCACIRAWEIKEEVGEDMNGSQLYCLSNVKYEVRQKNSYHIYCCRCFLVGLFFYFDFSNSIDSKFNSEQSSEFILFYHSMILHFMGGKTNVSVIKTCSNIHWNDHTKGMFALKKPFFSVHWDSTPSNELKSANRVQIDSTLCFKTAFGLIICRGILRFVVCLFFLSLVLKQ